MDRQSTVLALRRRETERLAADCASHESVLRHWISKDIHKLVPVASEDRHNTYAMLRAIRRFRYERVAAEIQSVGYPTVRPYRAI